MYVCVLDEVPGCIRAPGDWRPNCYEVTRCEVVQWITTTRNTWWVSVTTATSTGQSTAT